MSNRKRVDIKAILKDPVLRDKLMKSAADFICKIERTRTPYIIPPVKTTSPVFSSVKQQFMGEYIEKLNKRERELLEELKRIKVSRMYALAVYTAEDSK